MIFVLILFIVGFLFTMLILKNSKKYLFKSSSQNNNIELLLEHILYKYFDCFVICYDKYHPLIKNNLEGLFLRPLSLSLQHVILDRQYRDRGGTRVKYFMVGCKIQCL